ncbi:hypothetical protein [Streptomyces iranensis]|uniref:hypothetical protein n=1 Tax=Streptomyces iranensis TaxID=576784 RepID=UPI0039B78978
MAAEEAVGRAEHVDVVLRVYEAVALVVLDQVFDLDATGALRIDDLVGLGLDGRRRR